MQPEAPIARGVFDAIRVAIPEFKKLDLRDLDVSARQDSGSNGIVNSGYP